MPVRKIPKNHRSVTGRLPSEKADRPIAFESTLERDFLLIAEFDLNVATLEEQPVRIDYADETGRARHYTPDVLVTFRGDIVPALWMKPWLCEIKHRDDLRDHWSSLRRKIKAGRAYAQAQDWRFRVLTEHEIRTPYLDNARFLLPYRHRDRDYTYEDLLLDAMHELRESTPTELLAYVFRDDEMKGTLIPSLWRLVADQRIWCDLRLPLTMTSTIWEVDGHLPRFHPTVYPPFRRRRSR